MTLGVLCPLLDLLFHQQCPTLLFTLRSPLGACYSVNKEEPCHAKTLAPVTLQDENLATSTGGWGGEQTTLKWLQLSFLTHKQVLVLSYTQSTTPVLDTSHVLSLYHLVPCWLEEWYLAWHGDTGSPGC